VTDFESSFKSEMKFDNFFGTDAILGQVHTEHWQTESIRHRLKLNLIHHISERIRKRTSTAISGVRMEFGSTFRQMCDVI
jgi:hypothetical protein